MKTHSYPAWFYGPDGQSQVFNDDGEVPAGWHDHPSKVITSAKTGSKPMPAQTDKVPEAQRGSGPANPGDQGGNDGGKPADPAIADQSNTLDADGWPWDAKMHSATQSRTKAGLWRMKVGATRPAPKEGYPKPALDL